SSPSAAALINVECAFLNGRFGKRITILKNIQYRPEILIQTPLVFAQIRLLCVFSVKTGYQLIESYEQTCIKNHVFPAECRLCTTGRPLELPQCNQHVLPYLPDR